jgi:hypothetical protein
MSRNRLNGDASQVTVLPNSGAYNESVLDDFLIVAPGSLVGTHTVNLNGSLVGSGIGVVPADGDEVTISDPAGVASPSNPLVLIGRIGANGAQIRDGGLAGNSATYTTPGINKRLVYSAVTNTWNVMNGGSSTSGASSPGALSAPAWWIDSVAGSDTNDGQTALTPLKTMARLASLWGFGVLNPGPGLTVQVNIVNPLPITDPIAFNLASLGPSVCLFFQGIAATIFGPDIVSAVVPKNRATNTALSITGTALASWAPYLPAGVTPARVRTTALAGPTSNAIFWPAKTTGAVGRMSEPFKPQTPVASNYPSLNNAARPATPPAVGDTFVLESLTTVFVGACSIGGVDNGPIAAIGQNKVAFQNLDVQVPQPGARLNFSVNGYAQIKLYECHINETMSTSGPGTEELYLNCAIQRNLTGVGNTWTIQGGVVTGQSAFAGGLIFPDLDVLFQGVGFGDFANQVKAGTMAIFDAVGGPNNPSGSGLHVMPGCGITNLTFSDTTHLVWGSGNAGAGISCAAGGSFVSAANAPTITGAVPGTNDFTVAGASSLFPINPATGLPAAAPIACSWANFAAAYGGGTGFGGGASHPVFGGQISLGIS